MTCWKILGLTKKRMKILLIFFFNGKGVKDTQETMCQVCETICTFHGSKSFFYFGGAKNFSAPPRIIRIKQYGQSSISLKPNNYFSLLYKNLCKRKIFINWYLKSAWNSHISIRSQKQKKILELLAIEIIYTVLPPIEKFNRNSYNLYALFLYYQKYKHFHLVLKNKEFYKLYVHFILTKL